MIIQKKQNDIEELESLRLERYENIFNVYTQNKDESNEYYYYNILRKVSIDITNIDPDVFDYVTITKPIPWTTLSYDNYNTQHLWWLILAVNNIVNPLELPKTGNKYRIIRPEYIFTVLDQIRDSS
jgi:hypothetical protein